jgi:hypothetical protein
VRFVRRSIAAAGALAAAIAVAGCSVVATDAEAVPGGSPSPPATPTVRVEEGSTLPGADLADRIGSAMAAAGTGRATIIAGGSASTVAVRYGGSSVEERLTLGVEGSSMDLLLVGGVLYVSNMPDQVTTWIRLDPNAASTMSRFFMTALRSGFVDPGTLARALKGRTATVVDPTADRVSYTVSVDPKALLDGAAYGLDVPRGTTTEVTFVLDGRDRPIAASMTAAGQDVAVAYTDWGAAVDITAPPPADVGTFESPQAN